MTTEFAGARDRLATASGDVAVHRLGWLAEQGAGDVTRLPHTVKILLEDLLRRTGTRDVTDADVRALAGWPAPSPRATTRRSTTTKPSRRPRGSRT